MSSEKLGILARAKGLIAATFTALQTVPEIEAVTPHIEALNPSETVGQKISTLDIAHLYVGYLRLLREAANLMPEDLKAISLADQKIVDSSADPHTTPDILHTLGESYRPIMLQLLVASSDLESPIFQAALEDLRQRMTVGSARKLAGKENNDQVDDPEAKYAIFTHTKKDMQPQAQIHVVIGHGITRALTQYLSSDPVTADIAAKKDFLLHIIGDAMFVKFAKAELGILDHRQKPIVITRSEQDIFDTWTRSPQEGGLHWASLERYQAVKDYIAETFR